jgi:hypothetical protein
LRGRFLARAISRIYNNSGNRPFMPPNPYRDNSGRNATTIRLGTGAVRGTTATVSPDGHTRGPTGNVRLPRVYPLLGTHAEGELGRQASYRSESLSSRRQEGGRRVSCQPSPTDRGTARDTESKVEWSLRLLWHHGEHPCSGSIPSGRRSTLAEMAVSPLVGGPSDLGSIQPAVAAAPAAASGVGPFSVPLRSEPMT